MITRVVASGRRLLGRAALLLATCWLGCPAPALAFAPSGPGRPGPPSQSHVTAAVITAVAGRILTREWLGEPVGLMRNSTTACSAFLDYPGLRTKDSIRAHLLQPPPQLSPPDFGRDSDPMAREASLKELRERCIPFIGGRGAIPSPGEQHSFGIAYPNAAGCTFLQDQLSDPKLIERLDDLRMPRATMERFSAVPWPALDDLSDAAATNAKPSRNTVVIVGGWGDPMPEMSRADVIAHLRQFTVTGLRETPEECVLLLQLNYPEPPRARRRR
jgi:hypothetical protein